MEVLVQHPRFLLLTLENEKLLNVFFNELKKYKNIKQEDLKN